MWNRRTFLNLGFAAAISVCGGCGAKLIPSSLHSKLPNGSSRSNVLLIVIDDLNDWVGCMRGHPNANTPNIDRLANEGTLFTNAHCQAPLCGPSRASFLTGLYPSTTGIYGQTEDEDIKASSAPASQAIFLPAYFGQHGYRAMGIGKIAHEGAPRGMFQEFGGRSCGFGPYSPVPFHWEQKNTATDWGPYPSSDEDMPDIYSARWVKKRLDREDGQPFLLAVGFLRPHVPWYVPQRWFDLHPLESIELPPYLMNDLDDVPEIARQTTEIPAMPSIQWVEKNNQWRAIVQAYLASVSFADHCVGIVLDALRASPYADNTHVILWSDHGYHLGEKDRFAKFSLWDRSTHVPLIIKTAGAMNGQFCQRPVGLIDIYPTLIDLCGLPPNSDNEGRSLRPLLIDSSLRWPFAAITVYGENNYAIRLDDYRYIRYQDGTEELYDNKSDPNEWTNRAGDPSYQHLKARLKEYLPRTSAEWAKGSQMQSSPYFTEKLKATGKAPSYLQECNESR